MYIDPSIRELLDAADPAAPDFWQMTAAQAREAMSAGVVDMREPVDIAQVTDIEIPGTAQSIPARLYHPSPGDSLPLLVFTHGGGWIVGNLDDYDRVLRRLASDARMAVLSVSYRLAPEHVFPAAINDAYDALVWADNNRAQLGASGDFLAVAGDSSGGNLAAALAQRARDENGPHVDHQLLIYPVVTRDFDTDSYREFGEGYSLTRRSMEYFWDTYVGAGTARPKYADLLTSDLSGLAPATIITCSLDPLATEGAIYANALQSSGVATTHVTVFGLIHGSWLKDAVSRRAYELGIDIAATLRRVTGS
mgnify:CR=1 FL=1